ncbi:uncharacterized protein LOC102801485 [Saccoglossus kowalevskii]|uniref:Lymphocyte antigen 6B-like n=1 Tax=Saccoglossus kowalevskii TaxID=10224 RepID=A0ABM0MAW6_SACKO|nr:PREDICTED: lymphocyte antigen 6B-like [Saccoglossus kowalevskii]
MKSIVLFFLLGIVCQSYALECYSCSSATTSTCKSDYTTASKETCAGVLFTDPVCQVSRTDGDVNLLIRSCNIKSVCDQADGCITAEGVTVCTSCCDSDLCNTGNSATGLVFNYRLMGVLALMVLSSLF